MLPSSHWAPTALTDSVAALAVDGGDAYAALADGRVLRSSDGGAMWRPVAATTPEAAEALLPTPSALLLALPGGLRRLTADGDPLPTGGLPDAAVVVALARAGGVAVAGTLRRGVFRSEDDGATWTDANRGLPFGGAGLAVSGFATAGEGLFVAHPLGVSRSGDAGLAWEAAGFGLPLRMRRVALAASGRRLFAEVDGRLFHLADGAWTERSEGAVALLGADEGALYGLDPVAGLVRTSPDEGAWRPYGTGLPASPAALALGEEWRLAAPPHRGLWRRPAAPPPPPAPSPRLDAVPTLLSGGEAEVAFWLAAPSAVALSLVDTDGAEAARLAEGTYAAGPHRIAIPSMALPSGLYRCRLTAGGQTVSHPLAVFTVSA